MTAHGIDPAEFYTFVNAPQRASERRSVVLMFYHSKDPSAFASMLQDYARAKRTGRT